jgi:hypothetical protein
LVGVAPSCLYKRSERRSGYTKMIFVHAGRAGNKGLAGGWPVWYAIAS